MDAIRLNIEAIADFTKDMTSQQFSTDRLRFYAVTRALEIISEASRRLPDELKARYPDTRWRAIQGAGNVYRHTYGKVSVAAVWDTARGQLDDLKTIVDQELGEPEPPQPGTSHQGTLDEGSKE